MKIAVIASLSLVAFAGVAQADIVYTTGTLSQNFDTLPTATTVTVVSGGWVNDSTLAGWYAAPTTPFRIEAGPGTTGGLYSLGALTNPASTERALGSLASGGTGTVQIGASYVNANNFTLTDFTVTYDGEQWRNGGNTSAQSLTFSYRVLPAGSDVAAALIAGTGWTTNSGLNFTSPTTGAVAAALNGNLAANRVAGITATISGITWNAGDLLVIRWSDLNDSGNDHALAIDNLSFSAVPTPGAAALMGVGMLAATRRRRA